MVSRVLVGQVEPALGLGRPTILDRYPAAEAALARRAPDDPRVAERFELYACGVELANGFGELTDPAEHAPRFTAEMDEKQRVYGERYPLDEDFLAALGTDAAGQRHRARLRPAGDAGDRRAADRRRDVGAGAGLGDAAGPGLPGGAEFSPAEGLFPRPPRHLVRVRRKRPDDPTQPNREIPMTFRFLIPLAAALLLPAALAADPAMSGNSAKGSILTDGHGMSLYTFDPDKADMSACTGGCAANWPPLMTKAGDKAQGDWGIITRPGGHQWTYKGKPLYKWVGDTAAGDITGDGIKGVWHLARP